MSRRAVLWVAFVAVHLQVAVLGFVLPNQPMGDVVNVYGPWSLRALEGWGVVGISEPWVYPQLAIVPMVLAHGLAWLLGYPWAWAVLITVVDAVAFALLIGAGRSNSRAWAAWFWLAAIIALGPVGMYRIDGITVPLALIGCLLLIPRPWLASVLLAVATWIKVWPAALLAAAVIAVRQRLIVVIGALAVSAVVLIAIIAAGGAGNAFGFISGQTGRGLQIEAPVSTFYLWLTVAGVPDAQIYYDAGLNTFQVTGRYLDAVVAAMTPVLFVAVVAVAALGVWAHLRGVRVLRLLPPLALTLVLTLMVFNKVGSPQFYCWLVVPILLGILWHRARWLVPTVLGLLVMLLTQWIYPLTYHLLLEANAATVALVTVRNALLCVLLGWAVRQIVHAGRTARTRMITT